jgi:TrmH family RNA methyltransferase
MRAVGAKNARYQQWHALLSNRSARHRTGRFLVQGVRPITLALERDWPLAELLVVDRPLSSWATRMVEAAPVRPTLVTGPLLRELGGKDDAEPELIAVAGLPADDPARIDVGGSSLVVVFDRPVSPGNLGTVIRSADAFGAAGVVVLGHAADPYDPKSVRASTGSLFAMPVVRLAGTAALTGWLARVRAGGTPIRLVGTDEHGGTDLADCELTGPVALAVGNETSGMGTALRAACDECARIPITGSASSLNAATAAGVALYEATRQRRRARS